MKKSKLITTICTASTLIATPIIASSCSCSSEELKTGIRLDKTEVNAKDETPLYAFVYHKDNTDPLIVKTVNSAKSSDESILKVVDTSVTIYDTGVINVIGKKIGSAILTLNVTDNEGHTTQADFKISINEEIERSIVAVDSRFGEIPNESTVGIQSDTTLQFTLEESSNINVKWTISPADPTKYALNNNGLLSFATIPGDSEQWPITINALDSSSEVIDSFQVTIIKPQRQAYGGATANVGTFYGLGDYWRIATSAIATTPAILTVTLSTGVPTNGIWSCRTSSDLDIGPEYGDAGVLQYLKFSDGVLTIREGSPGIQQPVYIMYNDLIGWSNSLVLIWVF